MDTQARSKCFEGHRHYACEGLKVKIPRHYLSKASLHGLVCSTTQRIILAKMFPRLLEMTLSSCCKFAEDKDIYEYIKVAWHFLTANGTAQ